MRSKLILISPDEYSSCILINSGASFQDMDGSSMFGKDWRKVQRGLLAASHKVAR